MLWDFDVRVRERNLKTGRLKKEEVQKYYEGMVDVDANLDVLEVKQPAFSSADEKQEVEPVQLAVAPAYSPAPGISAPVAPMPRVPPTMEPLVPAMAPVVPVAPRVAEVPRSDADEGEPEVDS
jgi:hypothetical protein